MKLERIAIGIDFSESSVEAIEWVARYLAPTADLVLVHAVDVPEPPPFMEGRFLPRDRMLDIQREGAEARIARLGSSLPEARIRSIVRFGRPADQIYRVAKEFGADLIVAGKHGERTTRWDGPGGTADRISRCSDIPVLLVSGARHDAPKRLLMAVDNDEVADGVLRWTHLLSQQLGADVTAFHVVSNAVLSHVLSAAAISEGDTHLDEASIQAEFRFDAERWLERMGATGLPPGRVQYRTGFGHPAEEILNAADELDADLVILGNRKAGLLRRALIGTVAGELLHRAQCPVLTVHEPASRIPLLGQHSRLSMP